VPIVKPTNLNGLSNAGAINHHDFLFFCLSLLSIVSEISPFPVLQTPSCALALFQNAVRIALTIKA
jgi:hypothetical protein